MSKNKEQCIIFAKNLKYYLNRRNLTQKDFADNLGFPPTTVNSWMLAEKYPRIERIEKIAQYFGISKSDLIEERDHKPTYRRDFYSIPIIGEVCAGNGILAEENIIEYTGIDESIAKRGLFFGLKIKGDSMTPEIPDNSTVIVRQQPDVESGEIAIVFIEETSEGVCKVVYKKNNDIILQSVNASYPPLVFPNGEGVQIIGKVFECRIKINKKDAKK